MTILPHRPNTARLVIDVQRGVMAGAHDRDRVIANVGTLVERARAKDVPAVWVQHSSDHLRRDSEPWEGQRAPGRRCATVATADVDFAAG